MGGPRRPIVGAVLAAALGAPTGGSGAEREARPPSCWLAGLSPIVVSGRVEAERWIKRPDRYRAATVEHDGGRHVLSFSSSVDEYVVGWLYRVRPAEVLKGEVPDPKGTVQVFLRRSRGLDDLVPADSLRVGGTYLLLLVPPKADLPTHLVEPLELSGTTEGRPGPPGKREKPPRVESIYRLIRYPGSVSALRNKSGELDALRACWDESYRAPKVARLVAPEGPGIVTKPMFEWWPVERATSYELIVLGAGQREAALTLTLDASACDAASCALAAPVELAPGTYRWSVEARNRFGGSGRVVPLDFRIGPNPPVIVEGGMRIEATDGEARRLAARVAYPQWGLRCEWQFDPARVSVTETTSMPRTGGSAEVEARLLPGVESQEVVCRCTDWWGASGRATFTLTRD